MLRTLLKQKGPLKGAGFGLALIAAVLLAWFTINVPERGRDPRATGMEENSALFFATERDITALAQDAKTGAAVSIGLSAEYALGSLEDGGRYYVRAGEQRALLIELLKDKFSALEQNAAPVVFSLTDVQPPAPPLTRFVRQYGSGDHVLQRLLGLLDADHVLEAGLRLVGDLEHAGGSAQRVHHQDQIKDQQGSEQRQRA